MTGFRRSWRNYPQLPRDFYNELSQLIIIEEGVKYSPESRSEAPLYIMGEYCVTALGRGIRIYYGSFMLVYGALPEEALRKEMRRVLRHEFRHHLENLSGMRDLEILDAMELDEYKQNHSR